jgi:putative ABC transport system substrate-binding protein
MAIPIRRREFIATLGVAVAAWPLAARAQQPPIPVIGYLAVGSARSNALRLAGLRQGLKETGYVEGQNLRIEYRWVGDQFERLPAFATELVLQEVAVLVTPGLAATLAAKAATTTTPILFGVGADPVQLRLVGSLNRPGGNLTGFNQLSAELGPKAVALFSELVPRAHAIGLLVNPNNPTFSNLAIQEISAAAAAIGKEVEVVKATTDREIDAAFESLGQARVGALLVANDVFFNSQIEQIVALAILHSVPVMYSSREFVAAGGLISYGGSLVDSYRHIGLYTGRILNGEKAANLPVVQSTKIALAINLQTAKKIGLEIPAKVLAIADEVIE